ncbi:cytochrome P450 monooxygenase-like protein [Periconia macrospinosa]|uniref:Cytochrome P450 monooxygenase-like protein n=1 Tax=Periconia macrospinosa TaxID=97972 RepID=A0A2V1D642_9PLEO|nr:cytochrome P450 monooxygenase-like protein [Periconia macrospinosa]
MINQFLVAFLVIPVGLLLSSLWGLYRNYRAARLLGIPILILPVSLSNPIWMLLVRHLIPLANRIPFGSGYFTRFCYTGWEFKDRGRAHLEYGDAFVTVTPGKNWIYVCDANVVSDIIRRERQGEFERPVELLAMLDVFGPNLSTVHGADWQRQRKCTAATFNEHNNGLVWAESLRQSKQMLEYWKQAGESGTKTTASDTRTIALDVLLYAGFGKAFDFEGIRKKPSEGPISYRDALSLILENAVLILALGPKVLQRLSFIPGLGRLAEATVQFKKYMTDLFEEGQEKSNLQESNLLTSLVRAAVKEKQLSRDEVLGNMFVYNFAGHDTTAHTLAYTFLLLSANPDVQDWISEEINHVLNGRDPRSCGYDEFPRFKRTLSVLYETVRLFDPLLSLIKTSEHQPRLLNLNGNEVTVPANTLIVLNLNAFQTHPRYWGKDGRSWRPQRWITSSGNGHDIDREELMSPTKGSFIPWGEGLRACPGKKFAQVEHVGIMSAIFADHYVVPVQERGEDEASARARVIDITEDSGMVLLLQMFNPERAALQWRKRQ